MKRTAILITFLAFLGCGGSSSPTEPAATPTTPMSKFHLRDQLSGFDTVGGTVVVGALTINVPGGTFGGPGTAQLAAGTYAFTAKGLPDGFYKPTSGSFVVMVEPAANDFTFTLFRQQQ